MWRAAGDHRHISRGMRWEAGFSLAETLIAAAIGSVVLLGLYLMYDVNQVTFIRGEQLTDLQQNARIAMDRIVREVRLAGFDPQNPRIIPTPCVNAIQAATATSLRFMADVNSDGVTERVEYTFVPACAPSCLVDPPRIHREQWPGLGGVNCATSWSASGGAQPIADRVTALTFAYFDGAGNVLPTPVAAGSLGNIRRISVTITTADSATGTVPQPFRLRAEIWPRNLGQ